jgi:hypothetical protein
MTLVIKAHLMSQVATVLTYESFIQRQDGKFEAFPN